MYSFPCAAIKVVAFAGWGGVHVENAVHDDFGSLTAFSSLRYLIVVVQHRAAASPVLL